MRILTLHELTDMTLLIMKPEESYARWELGVQMRQNLHNYLIPDILEEQELIYHIGTSTGTGGFDSDREFKLTELGKMKQKALALFMHQNITPVSTKV